MSLLQIVFTICLIIFKYDGVLSSDLSKRILLGDTDSINGRLRQVEVKIQKLEEKSQTEIQNLTNTIHVLQQKVQEAENHIAFYATLTAHTTLGQKQTIDFDHIITNIGNGYNGLSGIFTVPITGIYQFSTTMFQYTSSSQHEIHTQLMKNNTPIGQNFGNSNRASATQTVIVSAQKGDIVYVRHHAGAATTQQTIFGQGYSSFSGCLIS